MSFADQSWQARFGRMGDEAEAVFEEVYPKGYIRFGLNRPPIRVQDLPLKIRYMPDYLTSSELVECQGFGRDQVVKVKLEKWLALGMWNAEMPVRLFLWDSKNERYGYVTIDQLTRAINTHGELGEFKEGKKVWLMPADDVGVEWQEKS